MFLYIMIQKYLQAQVANRACYDGSSVQLLNISFHVSEYCVAICTGGSAYKYRQCHSARGSDIWSWTGTDVSYFCSHYLSQNCIGRLPLTV